MSDYNLESPQERRLRRHEEDKKENTDRHNPNKEYYLREDFLKLCPLCINDVKDKYTLDYRTLTYYK